MQHLRGQAKRVNTIAFSPDEKSVLIWDIDGL